MATVLHGISNCDTVKKAKKWLTEQNIAFTFHDFRKQGLTETWLLEAESALGWEVLLNKRGTTYRKLDEADKQDLNKDKALALLLAHDALIKRPVLLHNGSFYCGFSDNTYAVIFA